MTFVVCFDGDDTLWHWEREFLPLYEELHQLDLSGGLSEILIMREKQNIEQYGYGANAFLLSMVEALLEWGADSSSVRHYLQLARDALFVASQHPHLIAGAETTLQELSRYPMFLVTRGDALEQHRKIAALGLKDCFCAIEIVREKTPECYLEILARHKLSPTQFIMIGDSLSADIRPVLEIGGTAIWIPYPLQWHAEAGSIIPESPRLRIVQSLQELPQLLSNLHRPKGKRRAQ